MMEHNASSETSQSSAKEADMEASDANDTALDCEFEC